LVKVVKNVLERFGKIFGGMGLPRGVEEMPRRCREVPRSSEKFREVPRSSEKCVRIGLHHDMRGRCAPGMAANHGKIGLNRGTWGRCAPSMAAKWSHLLLVL